jgi:hypothetical protein
VETEPVGRRAQHVLQALGGVAVSMEGTAELQHESDGGGVGLVAAPLEGGVRIGHLGSG